MSRSIKKGPYVEASLMKKVEEMNKTNEKRVIKTWSRASTIFPRKKACSRICNRGHGRTQTRRVRTDKTVQGPRRFQDVQQR